MQHQRRHLYAAAVLAITASTCQLANILPVRAAASNDDIVSLIDREHILAPGARVNVQVKNGTATISTFRHAKADEKDLKIDAVLISRAIMGLDPTITRAIFYFFSSADLSKYRQTTVSTGDVKAFAAGQVNKDELMASLPMEQKQTEDPNARVESAMQAGETVGVGHRMESAISGNEIDVSTDLDPSASMRDMKFAALQIAERALSAAPPNIKTVKIAFADPTQSSGSIKQILLTSAAIKALNASVLSAFSKLSVTSGMAAAPKAADVVPGVLQTERQTQYDKIKELEKKGVGIGQVKQMFDAIEKSVTENASPDEIARQINQLSSNLIGLDKLYKEAQERKAATGKTASGPPPKVKRTTGKVSRWVLGIEPIQESSVAADTLGYLAGIEQRLTRIDAANRLNVEDDPRFAGTLQFFIQVLAADPSKKSELVQVERRLEKIQQRHPGF